MVGAAGFEPATSCSQSRCATGLRYAPNGGLLTASGLTVSFISATAVPTGCKQEWQDPHTHQ